MKLRSADTVFARWVKKRDKYTCQRCGAVHPEKSQGLHCAHYVTRRNEATRFDEANCHSLCMGCHLFFHSHPREQEEWMIEKLGAVGFIALLDRKRVVHKKDDKSVIEKYKDTKK